MTKPSRMDTAANVATIALVLVALPVMATRYFPAESERPPAPVPIAVGSPFNSDGLRWKHKGPTVILGLSTTCKYCDASASFYQEVLSLAGQKGIDRLALTLQPSEEGSHYVRSRSLNVDAVEHADFRKVQFPATPMLVLLDTRGRVLRRWIGKLDEQQEKEVISLVSRMPEFGDGATGGGDSVSGRR